MLEYTVTTDPDLSPRWEQLQATERAHLLIANRATDPQVAEDAKTKATQARIDREALEEDIAAAARVITIERVDPKTWGRIVAEHPARKDVPWDAQMGFNTDTFDRALMPLAITSVTDGMGEPVDWDWATLTTHMSPGQYGQIMSDVLRLHMERDAVPFSLADWRSRRPSAQSSK